MMLHLHLSLAQPEVSNSMRMDERVSDDEKRSRIPTGVRKRTVQNCADIESGNYEEECEEESASEMLTLSLMPCSSVNESGVSASSLVSSHRNDSKEALLQKKRDKQRESRLRRKMETEELEASLYSLSHTTQKLTEEIRRLSEECEKMRSANEALEEEIAYLNGNKGTSSDPFHLKARMRTHL